VEAYLTPVGPGRVGLAFLFERDIPFALSVGPQSGPESKGERFDELLSLFPSLHSRFSHARPDSQILGAGPLARGARARVADRLVLLGDAAGYLDAVTGEGISLALGCAQDLAALLPDALRRGASAADLAGHERAWRSRYRVYAAWTRLVLLLARHPALRRGVLALAGAQRPVFERIVAAAVG
jgi:flavin-dependent dehydrogenase